MKKFQAQPGFRLVAHQLAPDPGAEASRRLMSHTGASRAAYNWAVGWVTAAWWQRKAEHTLW
ncbi:hypothetical protein AB0J81_21180 [Streptomyces bobili]|uniref:hypothetical protein n=1 Tax=Streptomyces bobili TaxID=67280 RepID=UPI0033DC07C2